MPPRRKEAVIQLAFIARSLQITPSRRRPGPIVQPAWSCPMEHGRRSDQTQVLVEAWVPACAGMARDGNSQIETMFVEANWVTASCAGKAREARGEIVNMLVDTDWIKASQAGAQTCPWHEQGATVPPLEPWVPAFAGMTAEGARRHKNDYTSRPDLGAK